MKMCPEHIIVAIVGIGLMSSTKTTDAKSNCHKSELSLELKKMCQGGYEWDCQKANVQNITNLPEYNSSSKLCSINFSTNKLLRVYNDSFRNLTDLLWLFLSHNKIDYIESDSLMDLTHLIYLDLRGNPLNYLGSFGLGLFSPLSNLKFLNIKSNLRSKNQSYIGLVKLLQPLQKLRYLAISGCVNCTFEEGFEKLSNLKKLSLSGDYYNIPGDFCNIPVLRNNTFLHMPQVQRLFMTSCNILKVETTAFSNLKDLNYLDISYNSELTFKGLADLLTSLKNTSVEVLNINHIHPPFEAGTVLRKKDIEPIKDLKNLTHVYIDLNKIEVIDEEVFALIPKKVFVLTLAANRLTYGKYTRGIEKLKYVDYLDISRQHLHYDPFHKDRGEPYHNGYESSISEHYHASQLYSTHSENEPGLEPQYHVKIETLPQVEMKESAGENSDNLDFEQSVLDVSSIGTSVNCSLCLLECAANKSLHGCFCPPPKIKTLKWRSSFIDFNLYSFKVCLSPPIKTMDLSYNLIKKWIGPILGIEQLENLYLTANFCNKLSPSFFDSFPNLLKLDISQNFLGQILHPSADNPGEHFKALKKLKKMNLTENRITALPKDIFAKLEHLQVLDLSNNMISEWNVTLTSNNLKALNLSNNKIESLSEEARNNLDNLAARRAQLEEAENLTVYLGGNNIQCNCEDRPFLKWLSDSPVEFRFHPSDSCHLPNGQKFLLDKPKVVFPQIVNLLNTVCFPYAFIAASACIFIITFVSCFVVYKLRWKLRYLYYKRYRRYSNKTYDRLYEKAAFVSYASSEGSFLKNKLVPALETASTNINLWIADRDSHAGASVAENLTHAIYSSKKTVMILSKGYLKENWCNYEMNMARLESIETNRKLFIIVLFDDISPKELPLDYLRLLHSETSIEYPRHPQDLDAFWISLVHAINDH